MVRLVSVLLLLTIIARTAQASVACCELIEASNCACVNLEARHHRDCPPENGLKWAGLNCRLASPDVLASMPLCSTKMCTRDETTLKRVPNVKNAQKLVYASEEDTKTGLRFVVAPKLFVTPGLAVNDTEDQDFENNNDVTQFFSIALYPKPDPVCAFQQEEFLTNSAQTRQVHSWLCSQPRSILSIDYDKILRVNGKILSFENINYKILLTAKTESTPSERLTKFELKNGQLAVISNEVQGIPENQCVNYYAGVFTYGTCSDTDSVKTARPARFFRLISASGKCAYMKSTGEISFDSPYETCFSESSLFSMNSYGDLYIDQHAVNVTQSFQFRAVPFENLVNQTAPAPFEIDIAAAEFEKPTRTYPSSVLKNVAARDMCVFSGHDANAVFLPCSSNDHALGSVTLKIESYRRLLKPDLPAPLPRIAKNLQNGNIYFVLRSIDTEIIECASINGIAELLLFEKKTPFSCSEKQSVFVLEPDGNLRQNGKLVGLSPNGNGYYLGAIPDDTPEEERLKIEFVGGLLKLVPNRNLNVEENQCIHTIVDLFVAKRSCDILKKSLLALPPRYFEIVGPTGYCARALLTGEITFAPEYSYQGSSTNCGDLNRATFSISSDGLLYINFRAVTVVEENGERFLRAVPLNTNPATLPRFSLDANHQEFFGPSKRLPPYLFTLNGAEDLCLFAAGDDLIATLLPCSTNEARVGSVRLVTVQLTDEFLQPKIQPPRRFLIRHPNTGETNCVSEIDGVIQLGSGGVKTETFRCAQKSSVFYLLPNNSLVLNGKFLTVSKRLNTEEFYVTVSTNELASKHARFEEDSEGFLLIQPSLHLGIRTKQCLKHFEEKLIVHECYGTSLLVKVSPPPRFFRLLRTSSHCATNRTNGKIGFVRNEMIGDCMTADSLFSIDSTGYVFINGRGLAVVTENGQQFLRAAPLDEVELMELTIFELNWHGMGGSLSIKNGDQKCLQYDANDDINVTVCKTTPFSSTDIVLDFEV